MFSVVIQYCSVLLYVYNFPLEYFTWKIYNFFFNNETFFSQLLNEQLAMTTMQPVLCPKASQMIAAYDEHVLVSHFKFGVLYQRFGQTSEEQLFSNRHSSPAFDEFLSLLGQRIQLKDHKG